MSKAHRLSLSHCEARVVMRPHIVAYIRLSPYINIYARAPAQNTTALCALDYSNAAAAGGIYIRMQFIKSSINTGSVYYTRIVRSLTHSARPLSHYSLAAAPARISICMRCARAARHLVGAVPECYYISAPQNAHKKGSLRSYRK